MPGPLFHICTFWFIAQYHPLNCANLFPFVFVSATAFPLRSELAIRCPLLPKCIQQQFNCRKLLPAGTHCLSPTCSLLLVSNSLPLHYYLQRLILFGEDSLLKWPGMWEPMIEQRDTIMARALFRAAKRESSQVPAYVFDQVGYYG